MLRTSLYRKHLFFFFLLNLQSKGRENPLLVGGGGTSKGKGNMDFSATVLSTGSDPVNTMLLKRCWVTALPLRSTGVLVVHRAQQRNLKGSA